MRSSFGATITPPSPRPARLQAAGFSKAILRVFSDDEKSGGLYFASGVFQGGAPRSGRLGRRVRAGIGAALGLDGRPLFHLVE